MEENFTGCNVMFVDAAFVTVPSSLDEVGPTIGAMSLAMGGLVTARHNTLVGLFW